MTIEARTRTKLILLSTALLAGALSGPAHAQNQSPLQGRDGDAADYPRADRIRETFSGFPGGSAPRSGVSSLLPGGAAGLIEGLAPRDAVSATIDLSLPRGAGAGAPGIAPATAPPTDGAGSRTITLTQLAFRDVPLSKGSDIMTITGQDGRLLVQRERNLPTAVDGATPQVTPEQAQNAAREAARAQFTTPPTVEGAPALEVFVQPDGAGRLAWKVQLVSPSLVRPEARTLWIAAIGPPAVLANENAVHHNHQGTVRAPVWSGSPLGGTASVPLEDLTLNRAAGGNATTDGGGFYRFVGGGGTTTVTAPLTGPNAAVQNQGGANLQAQGTGGTSAPIDLNFAAGTADELAQTSAFFWTNVARNLVQDRVPQASLANLPVRVNIADSCNAFWNGSSINFFRAGGACPNTAYADVVLHEYGHGVDDRLGGILDGGYSEGFGDALAVLATRQSCLGRDFFGAGTCLRNAADLIMWPPGPAEGVHTIGRRYAGFVWDMTSRLRARFGEDNGYEIARRLVLASAVGNPSSVPDAVRLAFLADDGDGNLATCSPNQVALQQAADSRSIPRPADCNAVDFTIATFRPWAGYAIPNGIWLSADINGDGKTDIVHLVQNSDYAHTWISRGDGSFQVGTFSPGRGYAIPNGVWLTADLNGDGKMDLVHVVQGADYVHTWMSRGDGTFAVGSFRPWAGYGMPNGRWLAADINGDGRTDLVHVVQGTDYVHPWISRGDGTFDVRTFRPWAGYGMPNGEWLVADINGDRRADLVHLVQGTDYVHPWISRGDGTFDVKTFRPWAGYAIPNGQWVAQDINADGRTDLVHLVQGTDYAHPWISRGDGTFDVKTFRPWAGYAIPNGVWLGGDLDGDRRGDLFHGVAGGGYAHPWVSRGDGTFEVRTFRPWAGYAIPNGIWLSGDFNGDGKRDILHAVQGTDYVHVWLSNVP